MHPHVKYRSIAGTIAIVLIFIIGLGWQAFRNESAEQSAPGNPLGEWVRLHQVRPARFPIVFMELHQNDSMDNQIWDVVVRIEQRSRIHYRGHLRIGNTIGNTGYKITDIHYGGVDDGGPIQTRDQQLSTITISNGTREIMLLQNRPEPHPDGGVWYELVYFPETPVRGLGSTFNVQPDKSLQLRYQDRTETYRLIVTDSNRPQLQQLIDGAEVGVPIPIKDYREDEHAQWVRSHPNRY